ncbi:hypothetical protein D8B26_005148 [Coccidioides posadasii str. Silveira]|uniref:uncharacterized protein n=1 Tax=Coccidioides posadasii (strain RMSCC 757 / Silveira) TaxID=443226 RepID=UPI001BF12620|nr:hypothetical protein D8B26_005148 [Coccidioides posadasii str. Silveira]
MLGSSRRIITPSELISPAFTYSYLSQLLSLKHDRAISRTLLDWTQKIVKGHRAPGPFSGTITAQPPCRRNTRDLPKTDPSSPSRACFALHQWEVGGLLL